MNQTIALVILGALGGLCRHIFSRQGRLMLPTINPKDGYLDLGFLTNTISGAIFGFLTPYGLSSLVQTVAPEVPIFANDYLSAWAMGLASAYIIEKLLGLQIAHRLSTVLPTDTRRAIKDFEKAIEEQRARNIPMPTVYPIEELPRVGYSPEQLLAEMRQGTPVGKAQIRGRKHFYVAEFPSPEALMAALTIRPLGYPLIEAPRQIVFIVGGGWGDVVTNHSAFFRQRDVVEYARSLGWKEDPNALLRMVVLAEANANRTLFDKALGIDQYTIWVDGTGHGNERVLLCGFNNDPLMDPSNYPSARGKYFTIVSCSGGRSVNERMAFDELFEKSYKDTVWVCIDNPNNPDSDKSSAQFHKCFLAQSRAILEDRELKETATIEIGVYHNEINAPGTPPINKYYLEINLGVRQDVVKRDEIWKNRLLGGAGPQPSKIDRVEFFLDGAKVGEATSPTSPDVFEFTCTVTKGMHRVKATAYSEDLPPKTSDEVEFPVVEQESKITCRIIAPKPGEEIPEGSLTIQVEAKVSA